MAKEIESIVSLIVAGVIWWNLFPIIRDQFYSQASTFSEPMSSLWMLIGKLFDPTVDIILAIIVIIVAFLKD